MSEGDSSGGMGDKAVQEFQNGWNILSMAAQGMYYDDQAVKLGLNPNDPKIVQQLEERYKKLNGTPLEEYVTESPNNSTLGAATQKANREQAIKSALQFYSKKYPQSNGQGTPAPQGFDFFKR